MNRYDLISLALGAIVAAAIFVGCVSSVPSVHMQTIEAWQEMVRDSVREDQ